MTSEHALRRKTEDYLNHVRGGLRSLPNADAAEIVEELRSHIRDRAEIDGEATEASLNAALEGLGRPQEVAAMYIAENVVARAEESFAPWLVLNAIVRWAGISSAGVLVFFVSLVGYFVALAFGLGALMKPLAPGRVGLWRLSEDSFSLVISPMGAPPSGVELLGWWIMPLGLLAGIGLFLLTARFGLWSLRKFQRMRSRNWAESGTGRT